MKAAIIFFQLFGVLSNILGFICMYNIFSEGKLSYKSIVLPNSFLLAIVLIIIGMILFLTGLILNVRRVSK